MMKATGMKNVKCIVQVSQIRLREKNKCSGQRQNKKTTRKTRSSTIGDMRTHHLCETSSNGRKKPADEQQAVKL